jgi:ATP-dependent DNA helicase RecG
VLKAIVAFANTSGGVILLGVEDKTRKVTGIVDVLQEEERLASLISDSISPKLIPSIEVMPWRKTHILAVEIFPSSTRPHHLNQRGPKDGVYVRVGSTNRRADAFLIEEMLRFQRVSTFDEQPMPELNSEVIDFRVASEYFKPIRKLTRPALQTLKILTAYQNRIVPTVGVCCCLPLTGSIIFLTLGSRLAGLMAKIDGALLIPLKYDLFFLAPPRK